MDGRAHIREVTDPCRQPFLGPVHRRTVPVVGQQLLTVVFVDVEASTELLTAMGDAAGTAAIERALQVVRDRVEPYEGRVVKGLGDGMMLTFESPRSAVAFAVAAQQAAPARPGLRIGMNFGEVMGDDPVGEAVNAAARIADKAAGGEILVSDVVCRLAGSMPGVRFVDRGRLKLKGFPTRWQLHGVAAAADVDEVPPVFGRDAELERLDALVTSALAGSGTALVLEGEAGIGKTHLVVAAAARARSSGAAVASGGADELEQDRPGRILSALADGLGVPFDDWARREVEPRAPHPAYAVVERFVDIVEDAAARRPVLLVVEDLHWADELSLRAIASLARRIGTLPVGLLATLRPTPRSPALGGTLEVLAGTGAPTLRLDGLDASAVGGVVASLTAAAPGAGLRRRLDATGGNPLYVTELVRALDEEGVLRIENGFAETDVETLPAGLAQTLHRRIAALPSDTVQALRLASLLGGSFSLDDLATIAGRRVVDVAGMLREAVDAGLVTGDGNHLAFRHDLIREAVYEGIIPAIRTDLHVAAARALARAGAPAGQVARHYALGARPGDVLAAEWLARAAAEARQLDTRAAVALLEEALTLAPPQWPQRIEVEANLVELLAWSGRAEDARELAGAVLDRSLAPAEELVARRALGSVLSTVGALAGAVEQMTAAAELPDVPDVERSILHCAAAGMAVIAGEATPADVRRTAEALCDTDVAPLAVWVHHTLAVAAVSAGDYGTQVEHARIACRILETTHVPPLGFLIPQTWLPNGHYNLDLFDEARAASLAAHHDGERRGDVGLVSHAVGMLAGLDYITGSWDDALSTIDAGLELADETGVRVQTVLLRALSALIALGRGDHDLASTHVAAGEAFYGSGEQHPFGLEVLLLARAQLLDADGDPDAARMLLGVVWDQTANLRGLIQWRNVAPELVRLARATGEVEIAASVASDVASLAARSPSASARVAADRVRGLADADGDVLLGAVERSRGLPRVVDAAGLCEEAALQLLAEGRGELAIALLDEAAGLHESMGAVGHLARIDAHLRLAGARRRRSRPAKATHGWDSLSPKEQEVVDLVAAGLSNPEIASRLYISRRTVETHLSHVFRKLDLSNRTQLAAAVVERAPR